MCLRPSGQHNLSEKYCSAPPIFGTGKRGHYQRGLLTGGLSRISNITRFSRKSWDSSLFSTVWGFSRISRISLKFSRISRKWTFLKRPLFQKTPFSEPDLLVYCQNKIGENARLVKLDTRKSKCTILKR